MERLNTVLPNGTFGMAVSSINTNFSLIVSAINGLEYSSTKSKGIRDYGFIPSTETLPNAANGDWCMVLSEGNTFPATIWTFDGTTWSQGGTWNPEGIDLSSYAKTTEMTAAIAASIAQAIAQIGYAEVTVSGTTLSASLQNYVLPTSGGTIHLKMSAPGTGASTLNINNTGAKELWYNGAAVSDGNTWETNEIISVFYDGTRFMASNSQGGGKADSQLDENSTLPVQNKVVTQAINTISANLQDVEDVVVSKDLTFTTAAGFVGTNGRITSGSSAGYRYTSLIPVREGQRIEVKCYTSPSTLAVAAYSAEDTSTAVVASSITGIGGLRTYTYNVPAGIAYIRVTNQVTNYASPSITRIAPLTHVLDTYDDALDDISVLQHKVLDGKIALNIINGQFVQSNGNTASNANYQYGEFAVKAGEKYRITNSSTTNALGVAAYKQGATAASVADSVRGAYALQTYDYVVPADIVKLRISHNKGSYPDALAVYNVSRFTEIEEEIAVERGRIDAAEEDVDDIQSFMYDGENKYVRANSGYVQTDGTILNATISPYNYSVLIPVMEGEIYEVNTAASLSVLAIAAYSAEDTTTADVSNSVIKNGIFTIRYVVPTGIAYLRITCNVVNLPSPYIKRIATYNAKFDEIDERLGNLEGGGAKSKPISILFIGNSLTQDAISYLPWLLTTLAPEVSFKFYIWYCGGYTLAQHYSRISNNQNCETFSRCEDNTAWTNSNNSTTMQYILEHYKFDIVCLQEYFNYKSSYTDADLAPFNNIISYIRANYNYPFKVATLFHQPKRDVAESVFNLTKQGNGLILQKTDAEILNPAGIAIYRAMSTDLDNLGDQGHLSPDGTHSQEGLPCILQAYVSALWIFDQLSLPRSVVNDKQRITTAIYNSLYIPGPNGSLVVGTDEQYNLAQDVAVKAWKEGIALLNANLTEFT